MPKAATASPPRRNAFASALRRLSRRDHSEAELRAKLLDEGHEVEAVDDAVARAKAARYVDDKTYAERYTRSRLVLQGKGRGHIRHGLRRRGVAGTLVDGALRQAAADGLEQEALDAVAAKYWRLHARVAPPDRLRRLWAFLIRRGFPAGLVHARLRALWPGQDEILEGLEVEPEE
jgi:regulatory protein